MKRKTPAKRTGLKVTLIVADLVITDGKVTVKSSLTYGVCAKCGCTDFDCSQCIEDSGVPCSWVDDKHTLCSRCASAA